MTLLEPTKTNRSVRPPVSEKLTVLKGRQQRGEAQQAATVMRSSMLHWKDRSFARCLVSEGFNFLLGRGFPSRPKKGITLLLPLMHAVRLTRGKWEVPQEDDICTTVGGGWVVGGDTNHQPGSRRGL